MTNWNMRTEPLELKDGSTIKNYHYEFNSTDRVLAKIVEDVFKGIMDISADRKTENSSEKPNNCEPFDKDINVRSKDEPQTLKCFKSDKYKSCEYVGKCDNHICLKALSEGEKRAKTEPQTERSE